MGMTIIYRDHRGTRGSVQLAEAGDVYIGRSRDCQIHTDDGNVSRKHAVIRSEAGRLYIEDLGSSGGTKVNDAAVSKHPLVADDVIECGQLWLRCIDGPAPSDW